MSFIEVTDNELIYLLRSGNDYAKECFIERYRYRLYGLINRLNVKNEYWDYEDFFQECFMVFLKCIDRFDEEYNFYNYLTKSVNNHIKRLVKDREKSEKIISLDYSDEEKVSIIDVVSEDDKVYKNLIVENYIKEKFDPSQQEIIRLKLNGYTYGEISKIMNMTKKQLYKKVNMVKEIVKKELI